MSVYDFDIALMIKRLLPTRKRDQNHLDLIDSLVNGSVTVQTDLQAYRTATLLSLSYNSQTIVFNKLLNDNHDATLKRIYIDNSADDLEDSYCYEFSEAQFDAYAYNFSEEPFTGRYTYDYIEYFYPFDFTVNVPSSLSAQEPNIKALVNFYKLAGKRYTIKYF